MQQQQEHCILFTEHYNQRICDRATTAVLALKTLLQ